MKKILFSLLVVLLICGTAYAVSIPQSESGTTGPAIWTVPIYNNDGETIDVGDVVIWDIDNSTGDNDNYVVRTTTADTYLVAGVVYPADIAAGDVGTIAIRGVVQVDMGTTGKGAVDSLICTSTTEGSVGNCVNDAASFGIITTAISSGSVNAFINVR